eukprot:5680317-Prymnesium_polylepis.1
MVPCLSRSFLDPRFAVLPGRPFDVWRALRDGRNATLTVLGGSSSAGSALESPRTDTYFAHSLAAVNAASRASGGGSLHLRNMAQGSTRTPWALTMLESLAERSALSGGLVIWEYAINDSFLCGATHQELSRLSCVLEAFLLRLANLPTPPA